VPGGGTALFRTEGGVAVVVLVLVGGSMVVGREGKEGRKFDLGKEPPLLPHHSQPDVRRPWEQQGC